MGNRINWPSYILKYRYFSSTGERLRGLLLSLLILISVFIMIFDIYGSIKENYIFMYVTEAAIILLLLMLYLLFPRFISLKTTTFIVLGFITLFILASLTIPGYNQAFVLFTLAIVPAYLFFFLGTRTGIKWNTVVILLLILTTLNAYTAWITPVFTAELLMQTTIAYIALSYFYYMLEKERNRYEEELSVALKNKEVLLKEVHHRAKNNLQIIMGLLESQAFRTKGAACKKILISQRYRLQAMSLIHESLSYSTTYEKVDMSQYIKGIANNIQKYTHHTIVLDLEPCVLGMSDAMNLGLFLNEAISNASEHAYAKEVKGRIEVSLKYREEQCVLRIKDFGRGFDTNRSSHSLGLVLMEDISNFFNEGNMMIDFEEGTEIVFSFTQKKNT